MGDADLWSLMQRVEKYRYRAQLLERAAIDQPPTVRRILLRLAAQSRRLAARAHAGGEGAPAVHERAEEAA